MNLVHFRKTSIILVLLTALMLSSFFLRNGPAVVNGQGSMGSVVSYRVTGAPDYAHPGSESFWDTISWTEVPLAASVSPGGGHTPTILVKSANDGFNVYVLFKWNDSVGPSFGSSTEAYLDPNGTLVPLDPASTAQVKQLFYNSTYYYPDQGRDALVSASWATAISSHGSRFERCYNWRRGRSVALAIFPDR